MHNGMPQLKTHRELFAEFFASLFGYPLEDLVAGGGRPAAAEAMWAQMSRDITTGGSGAYLDPIAQVGVPFSMLLNI